MHETRWHGEANYPCEVNETFDEVDGWDNDYDWDEDEAWDEYVDYEWHKAWGDDIQWTEMMREWNYSDD